jgi:hypothetical protein
MISWTKAKAKKMTMFDDVDDEMYLTQQRMLQVAEWKEDYYVNCKSLWCQSLNSWKQVSMAFHDNDKM